MRENNLLFIENATLIEEMYQLYLKQPNSVDISWQNFFATYKDNNSNSFIKTSAKILLGIEDSEVNNSSISNHNQVDGNSHIKNTNNDSAKVKLLVEHYRKFGHLLASLDPLKLEKLPTKEELKFTLENFGFNEIDLDKSVNLKLGELVNYLDQVYCSSIGLECSHLSSFEEYEWITDELENQILSYSLSKHEKKQALMILFKAETFEQFLHTKFPGGKRFSIEGGESSIACLKKIIDLAGKNQTNSVTLGMAHRGRLNTLVHIMAKPLEEIFAEFLGVPAFSEELGVSGDVKYHMGRSSTRNVDDGCNVHLSLTPNPSHLEAVNAVVMGQVKAKQDLEQNNLACLGILIHGDAAFCGQGVIAENLIMSGIDAYNTQGIIHIVVNNQVGFTADPTDAHTGRYPTDFAKIIAAPIIHVNGDDIEAVIKATNIAVAYRYKFAKDVVIDIVCYRKYGHNEGDEPAYTQVNMYKAINDKKTTMALYAEKLINEKVIENLDELNMVYKHILNTRFEDAQNCKPLVQSFTDRWEGYSKNDSKNIREFITGVDKAHLKKLCILLCNPPLNFNLHPKLRTLFDNRIKNLEAEQPIDWATAEQMAFASLLTEQIPIRLTGQDSGRGTFSHRHSILYDQQDGSPYIPLNHLQDEQAKYFVANSNLSEYSVLGFEYGYSTVSPKHLVIWEAQYGDFANGAQIVIDQFISSSETKWLRQSGLVMLLPHGYEGGGPEHSSARLERFLQLCAEDNIQVTYPTTPASIFHLLRRQLNPKSRAPLIVMSPKSLLRNKLAVSRLDELSSGTKFLPVLDDQVITKQDYSKVEKIICCTGKIYYELFEARKQANIQNTVIIRFEQLYPFPAEEINKILRQYANLKQFIWCQEEPYNMGAWEYIRDYLNQSIKQTKSNNQFQYIGRKASASPATGFLYMHNKEQQTLIKQALNIRIEGLK